MERPQPNLKLCLFSNKKLPKFKSSGSLYFILGSRLISLDLGAEDSLPKWLVTQVDIFFQLDYFGLRAITDHYLPA